jgi:hypothetical protein
LIDLCQVPRCHLTEAENWYSDGIWHPHRFRSAPVPEVPGVEVPTDSTEGSLGVVTLWVVTPEAGIKGADDGLE